MNAYRNWVTNGVKMCRYFLKRHFLAGEKGKKMVFYTQTGKDLKLPEAVAAFWSHTHSFPARDWRQYCSGTALRQENKPRPTRF